MQTDLPNTGPPAQALECPVTFRGESGVPFFVVNTSPCLLALASVRVGSLVALALPKNSDHIRGERHPALRELRFGPQEDRFAGDPVQRLFDVQPSVHEIQIGPTDSDRTSRPALSAG